MRIIARGIVVLISEKKLENAQMELSIEVPADRVELEYKAAFDRIQRNAKIDGFRKGRVPREIIERRFTELADQEVAEHLLRGVYLEVVQDKDFKPISQPRFDFGKPERGKSFPFTAVFDMRPEARLGDYKGLSVEERSCAINEEDVASELETIRERNASISKKEDGGRVENGDLVKVRIKRIDNVDPSEIEKLDFREYQIVVGKSKESYAIDNDLLGMVAGEEKEVKVKYPKDYASEELAGQSVRYLVKIDEINRRDLPALDDDFAKDLGSYESLDQLKDEIRKNLEEFVSGRAKGEAKNALMKEIVAKSSFEIPPSMVEKEMEALLMRLQERMGFQADDINQFAAVLGINAEELSQKLREEALGNIKSMLVLSEVSDREKLTVPEEKYRQVLDAVAKRNNKSIEEIEKIVAENNTRGNIESELLLERAMDFIYENASVKKKKPVPLSEFIKGEKPAQ